MRRYRLVMHRRRRLRDPATVAYYATAAPVGGRPPPETDDPGKAVVLGEAEALKAVRALHVRGALSWGLEETP